MIKQKIKEKGFTLLELLVAVALTGVVSMVVATTVLQMFSESERSTERLSASLQVANAGFWLERDTASAQSITVPTSGTFVIMQWTSWNGEQTNVAYSLVDSSNGLKKLVRNYSVEGSTSVSAFIADSIVAASTSAVLETSGTATQTVLRTIIEAQVGNQNAARTYQFKPRARIF